MFISDYENGGFIEKMSFAPFSEILFLV